MNKFLVFIIKHLMMTNKLQALSKVNKKINQIQKTYQIKMSAMDVDDFNFDIPIDEGILMRDFELSGGNSYYKRIKLHNFEDETINLIVYYGKEGNYVKKHNHEEPHLIICLEGNIEMVIDDEKFDIKTGHSIYVNSFQWHDIFFKSSSKLIIAYI
jgi:quercetin dioxygenase-like cupin family protein